MRTSLAVPDHPTLPSVGELEPGLYEALVTDGLAARLKCLERLTPEQRDLNAVEAPDRIASHI